MGRSHTDNPNRIPEREQRLQRSRTRDERGNHLGSLSYELGVPVEDVAQLGRRLDAVLLHHVEQAEDVAYAGERDALLARQVLDHLDLADVALRVTPSVGGRAMRFDETGVLVQHQGPRMRLENLGRDADRVQRLLWIAERLGRAGRAAGGARPQ